LLRQDKGATGQFAGRFEENLGVGILAGIQNSTPAAGCVRAYMRGADSLWWHKALRPHVVVFFFFSFLLGCLLASAVKASTVDVTPRFRFQECASESFGDSEYG